LNLASFVVQGVRRRLVLLQMTSSARARISSSVLRCVPDRRFSLSLHDALLHRRLAEFAFLDSQFALRYFQPQSGPARAACDWHLILDLSVLEEEGYSASGAFFLTTH